MLKFKSLVLLVSLFVCCGVSPKGIAQTLEADGVQCANTDGSERSNQIFFATVQATPQGYDLLIVDEVGKYIFTLQPDWVVSAVSSIEGQELVPWNLTAYDGTPITLSLEDGMFAIEMMVSTRSFCSFQGRAQILDSLD